MGGKDGGGSRGSPVFGGEENALSWRERSRQTGGCPVNEFLVKCISGCRKTRILPKPPTCSDKTRAVSLLQRGCRQTQQRFPFVIARGHCFHRGCCARGADPGHDSTGRARETEPSEKLLLLMKCPRRHGCRAPACSGTTWRSGAPGGAVRSIDCRAMARTEVRGPILGSPVRLVLWKVTDLLLMLRLGVQMCLLLVFNLRGAPASCPCLDSSADRFYCIWTPS